MYTDHTQNPSTKLKTSLQILWIFERFGNVSLKIFAKEFFFFLLKELNQITVFANPKTNLTKLRSPNQLISDD